MTNNYLQTKTQQKNVKYRSFLLKDKSRRRKIFKQWAPANFNSKSEIGNGKSLQMSIVFHQVTGKQSSSNHILII